MLVFLSGVKDRGADGLTRAARNSAAGVIVCISLVDTAEIS